LIVGVLMRCWYICLNKVWIVSGCRNCPQISKSRFLFHYELDRHHTHSDVDLARFSYCFHGKFKCLPLVLFDGHKVWRILGARTCGEHLRPCQKSCLSFRLHDCCESHWKPSVVLSTFSSALGVAMAYSWYVSTKKKYHPLWLAHSEQS
jgi:hypothetical protein